MADSHFFQPPLKLLTPGTPALLILMGAGLLATVYRFALGLGSTTNLSDQFPWGIWVAFDVICGVALAAGGFTTAAVVYIFCGERYHSLVRPAILMGFIGYVFVAIGLIVDLGIPWHIYHPIIFWPKHSALFEVAWCVMLYTSVLALEFLPSVFERFGWHKLQDLMYRVTPYFVVMILSWFTFIMSHSVIWAAVAFVVLATLAVFMPRLVSRREGVPVVLIIAGILLSTAHQSSLGTLFLLMPDKLHPLWYTPMLPIMFYVSAVAVGFAMVIFESTISSRNFGLPVEEEALAGMSHILVYILGVYLLIRLADVVIRGQAATIFSGMGVLFLSEIGFGVVIPIVVLSIRKFRQHTWLRFSAALLVILGLIFNRFNVTLFAMDRPGHGMYFPSPEELLISIGLVAAIVFFYSMMVRAFPVLPAFSQESVAPAPEQHPVPQRDGAA